MSSVNFVFLILIICFLDFFCDIVSIFMYRNTMIFYVYILSHVKSERPRFSRGFPILATGFFSLVFHPGFFEFIMDGHKSCTFSLIHVVIIGIKVVGGF